MIIGDSISRMRNVLKAVREDTFMTDRFLYSLIMKYAKTLMQRDLQKVNLFKNSGLFKEDPCVELIDIDRVSACCVNIKTGCTFKRSKEKLPAITNLNNGPVIRAVTTLDYSIQIHKTEPSVYANMTNLSSFKYNKRNYYWIVDGYLYIPDVEWEAVRVQALFEESISNQFCSIGSDRNVCMLEQDRELNIPEYLFSEIEQLARQEVLTAGQIPSDGADDSQNIMR